jgi:hypothetical protein
MPAKVGAGKDGSDDGGAGGSGWEGGSGGGQVVVRPRVVLRFSAHVLVEPSCKRLDAGAGKGVGVVRDLHRRSDRETDTAQPLEQKKPRHERLH